MYVSLPIPRSLGESGAHRGSGPRMVAQPAIALREPLALRDGAAVCAVERAILRGLRPSEGPMRREH